ncbi:MAG: 16S rRNA (uracil(1498)-N(3))-methyltransferase [Pirellulaceae bacterium]|jgi:16S rRNA (uracil1498-N3)-methyltransferase|nr:16S rRNA (uracil(1498)-N(3))-methyltransferase [Pirellulaceae bacterium]
MGQRFFVDAPIVGDQVLLTGSEAHHLLHVMRAAIGDEVLLFDGSGCEYVARVERLGRRDAALRVRHGRPVDRELPGEFVVGVALPKADRQRWLIEKLVELGATRLVPLRTQRSVVHPDPHAAARLRRSVIEASKQCGRLRLMEVAPLVTLAEYLAAAPAGACRWLADPAGDPPHGAAAAASGWFVAVGPEGGWTADEQGAARARDWQIVSLGPRTLRIETACLVLAAWAARDFATA